MWGCFQKTCCSCPEDRGKLVEVNLHDWEDDKKGAEVVSTVGRSNSIHDHNPQTISYLAVHNEHLPSDFSQVSIMSDADEERLSDLRRMIKDSAPKSHMANGHLSSADAHWRQNGSSGSTPMSEQDTYTKSYPSTYGRPHYSVRDKLRGGAPDSGPQKSTEELERTLGAYPGLLAHQRREGVRTPSCATPSIASSGELFERELLTARGYASPMQQQSSWMPNSLGSLPEQPQSERHLIRARQDVANPPGPSSPSYPSYAGRGAVDPGVSPRMNPGISPRLAEKSEAAQAAAEAAVAAAAETPAPSPYVPPREDSRGARLVEIDRKMEAELYGSASAEERERLKEEAKRNMERLLAMSDPKRAFAVWQPMDPPLGAWRDQERPEKSNRMCFGGKFCT